MARSGARLYVLGRFVRRNRLLIAGGALVALAVVVAVSGIAWQAHRAQREAARATAVKDFLAGIFRASDPRIASDKPRGQITARELLGARGADRDVVAAGRHVGTGGIADRDVVRAGDAVLQR
jgi:hypothetical protein